MKVFSLKSLALATAVVSSAASAVTIPLPAGPLALEDDNLEYVIDGVTGLPKTTGSLAVGDVLYAFITFDKVASLDNSFVHNLGATEELTGVSAIEVTSVAPGGDFTFGPSAAFTAIYGAGAMAALFADSPNFGVDCHLGGIATCHAEATGGDLWMVAGFGDADDFWLSTGSLPGGAAASIDFVAGLNAGTNVAVANYSLSILTNNTGTTFREQDSPLSAFATAGLGDLKTDIIGSGTVLGGAGLTSPFFARSDFDFTLDRIPEPGSLALLGAGLLLAGAARRRKAK